MQRLVRVRSIEPLEGFCVRLSFEDGTQREVDLERYLHGPIFESIRRDLAVFRSVRVDHGVVTWPNGADIDPDVLYYGLKPAWMEQESTPERRAYTAQAQAAAGLPLRETGEAYTSSDNEASETP